MSIQSKAQRRYLWAKDPKVAKKWQEEHPGSYKDLPEKHKEAVDKILLRIPKKFWAIAAIPAFGLAAGSSLLNLRRKRPVPLKVDLLMHEKSRKDFLKDLKNYMPGDSPSS